MDMRAARKAVWPGSIICFGQGRHMLAIESVHMRFDLDNGFVSTGNFDGGLSMDRAELIDLVAGGLVTVRPDGADISSSSGCQAADAPPSPPCEEDLVLVVATADRRASAEQLAEVRRGLDHLAQAPDGPRKRRVVHLKCTAKTPGSA